MSPFCLSLPNSDYVDEIRPKFGDVLPEIDHTFRYRPKLSEIGQISKKSKFNQNNLQSFQAPEIVQLSVSLSMSPALAAE